MASKPGGLNVRNGNDLENWVRSEIAERVNVVADPIGLLVGKADVAREETGRCTLRDHRGTGPGIRGRTRRDNVGKLRHERSR